MAKEKIAPGAKRGGTVSKVATWVIGGLLLVGLAGFGAGSFGGGGQRVATVEGQVIDADDLLLTADAIRRNAARQGRPLPFAQVQSIALGSLVTDAALDAEALRLGLSAGDERVARAITDDPRFRPLLSFDRSIYREFLESRRESESAYEERLRRQLARAQLEQAVIGGVEAPRGYLDIMTAFLLEGRDVRYAILRPDLLPAPIADPTEAELAEWYEANAEAFTIPAAPRIAYLWIAPEAVAADAEIDEARLRALYDERAEEFRRPERRLVERLVFADEAAARAVLGRIATGASDFDAEVAAAGLAPEDVDLGDVTFEGLGGAAEAVFARTEPGLTRVVPTEDGPAIFRVNALLNAVEIPFEDVREELTLELGLAGARRVIDDLEDEVDDLLAGGATVEDVAAEIGPAVSGTLFAGPDGDDPLLGYDTFREAARAATEDDFPEAVRTDDGGLFALRLDGMREARAPALDEVRGEVLATWRREAETDALMALAEALRDDFAAGEAPLDTIEEDALVRVAGLDGAPPALARAIFETPEGGTATVRLPGAAALVHVDQVTPADPDDPATRELRAALVAENPRGYPGDVFAAYARALQARMDVTVDQAMLNAIAAQYGN
ncbi:peptidyl-prolyl cis-trans isomerase D [Hasllibacter halocynthiae]|uniref:Peptidyl-prolyl cis-trans isomerase D n=1 Tax=Hasllibacter halocynthiae TaxID=595589 RepID=A0A2T0X838_9RHOB|nr:peptidyl-prolyl cis-trans isomerase [Hasllibacter halocynthiae]PRY95065.1 peptidyl-prolyl cis-trans isomerase D [Hasllibacter halocynthiae]